MIHDPALEAAILANRDDPEAYLVYADWLSSRGDPRGELIALQYRADRVEPENGELLMYRDEHLRRHPGLVPALDIWQIRLGWRWGFIDDASIEDQSAADLQELLEHPSCRLLRKLEIVAPHAGARALLHVLLEIGHPAVESLIFEQGGDLREAPAYVPDDGSWSKLPRLLHLTVTGRALSRTLEHPALQSLAIQGGPFESEASWNLPALTTLAGSGDLDALCSAHLPSLRHLDLWYRDVFDLLAHDGFLRLLPRLETLRASLGALAPDPVEQLCQQAARLAHLRELDLVVPDECDPTDEEAQEQAQELALLAAALAGEWNEAQEREWDQLGARRLERRQRQERRRDHLRARLASVFPMLRGWDREVADA